MNTHGFSLSSLSSLIESRFLSSAKICWNILSIMSPSSTKDGSTMKLMKPICDWASGVFSRSHSGENGRPNFFSLSPYMINIGKVRHFGKNWEIRNRRLLEQRTPRPKASTICNAKATPYSGGQYLHNARAMTRPSSCLFSHSDW